jgi:hypothetical protein
MPDTVPRSRKTRCSIDGGNWLDNDHAACRPASSIPADSTASGRQCARSSDTDASATMIDSSTASGGAGRHRHKPIPARSHAATERMLMCDLDSGGGMRQRGAIPARKMSGGCPSCCRNFPIPQRPSTNYTANPTNVR